jgi:hypothetical protein
MMLLSILVEASQPVARMAAATSGADSMSHR